MKKTMRKSTMRKKMEMGVVMEIIEEEGMRVKMVQA